MSKRSASSVPSVADRARSRRRVDSPISGSGSSSDQLSPTSSVVEDDLADWRRRYSLSSFVALRVPTSEERASSYILGEIVVYKAFFDSGLRGIVSVLFIGLTASRDEVTVISSRRVTAVKVKPSSSSQGKKYTGGGVTTRSAQQSADIARSARSLATALSNLNLKLFPQDGTILPLGEPSEVVQVLQGGLLRALFSFIFSHAASLFA
ncbi:hypothetical protein Bca52824_026935 [Brassica carinata]|uniref:Uncharacterized protein n=1 Tax=Brassica carinata TaxID=52824 RepID=A0A8X7V9E5_BRACI|nr:hypothetical protein Bca52824_026935 [Brassica carinata]